MTEKPTDSFELFGKLFQTRVIQGTITDYKFFQNICEIMKPEFFSSTVHRELWKKMKAFFEKYKTTPSTESLRVEFATYDDKEEITKILYEIDHKISISEIEQAKDKAFKFCSNKAMEAAIIDSVDLLRENKFDEIQHRIEKALKESVKIDLGHEYFESLSIRSKRNMRNTVSTGLPVLDSAPLMDGGLASGELGIVMAQTGGGKSFFLVNFGVGALKEGKDVVHYTFELSEYNIGLRYDSCITGIETKQIPERVSEVESLIKNFKGGKLIIKEFPTKTATINNIRFHFEHLRACGYNPKLIIVDYADLMRSRRGYEQKRYELESIYEDLRGLAMDIKVPIWSASQSNRCVALDTEVITANGKKQIQNINVGEEILTHKGYRKVLQVFPIENKKAYRITTASGKKIEVSDNHQFPIFSKSKNKLSLESISSEMGEGDLVEVWDKNHFMDEIVDVELLGNKDLIDIEVEDTHMFYANDIYTHNSGFDGEIITLDKIGEAISKAQICDFIGTFSSNMSEKRKGLGKFFIAKNRLGEDGYWLPTSVDFSKASIKMSNRIEDDDISMISGSEESTSSIIKELFKDRKDKKGLR